MQRYADIPLDDFSVTDEEIKAYYDEHKDDAEYEQEEARDVQMIYFPIAPTESDTKEISTQLENLKSSFKSTVNNIGFVYQNSDAQFLSDSAVFKIAPDDRMSFSMQANAGNYPASADAMIQDSEIGDVFGPFLAYNNDEKREELAIVKVVKVCF